MKAPKKPKASNVIIVKDGSVAVKIYPRVKDGKNGTQTYFQLADYSSGRRVFRSFNDEAGARKEAKRIAEATAKGDVLAAQMTGEDRQTFAAIITALKPCGVKPLVAATEYAEAQRRLAGRSLLEAVDFFLARNVGPLDKKTVEEAVKLLIVARKGEGRSEPYLHDLQTRLDVFAESFHCKLSDIAPKQINEFLRALDCGGRSKNNYRRAIGTLFKFAEIEGFVSRGHIASKDLARSNESKAAVEIFTPNELRKLLAVAQIDPEQIKLGANKRWFDDRSILPLLVLGAFAGMRTAEVERQLWSDIDLEQGEIVVTAEKGNTAQNRIIPISDTLKKWLLVCKRDGATCCTYDRTSSAIDRLSERAGVGWRHNGLRHSYISYRVAETKDVPKVALEAGNSPAMIFKHYRKPISKAVADEWFAVTPEKVAEASNIVPMPKAA